MFQAVSVTIWLGAAQALLGMQQALGGLRSTPRGLFSALPGNRSCRPRVEAILKTSPFNDRPGLPPRITKGGVVHTGLGSHRE